MELKCDFQVRLDQTKRRSCAKIVALRCLIAGGTQNKRRGLVSGQETFCVEHRIGSHFPLNVPFQFPHILS